ncbi:hypothetical protein [Deinococcus sp. DB0503]|uniref:hypothetical protein n=1 Tax=Deinococcus sp. DB0503 TaxID=2479203 RepID=UPI0018DF381B|nr:hypothetical protein [Deinococcus sp. DB0503]MBI0445362.1 hypothetical protein [Deinococcus sp. DB0503]
MNHKNIDPARLAAAHACGLKDSELAELFGASRSTIKRRRETLGLPGNCPRNTTGKLGEQLVAAYLTGQGFKVTPIGGHNPPSDLLVNGWRVDVKASRDVETLRSGLTSVQFRLPSLRSSNMSEYRHRKDYQRDTDFFALAALAGQEMTHLYLLPVSRWQGTITVHPDSPFCPFQPYRGNVAPLRSKGAAAA